MQVNVLFQVFGILLCSACLVEGDSYADRVKNLFERHFKTPNNTCWSISNQTASAYKGDMRMAVALINVYTQVCKNYADNVNGKPLYAELNKQLRDQTKVQIWLDTEQLLNQALQMVGIATRYNLYRACECSNIKQGHTFTVNYFWSTSLLPRVANRFLKANDFFFHILQAPGSRVSDYSFVQSEKEILLQSKLEFYVKEYVDDKENIENKTSSLEGVSKWNQIKAFVVVTGEIPTRGSRSALKSGYCNCSGGTTSSPRSAALKSMPTSFFSASFFIVFRLVW
ncbi:uncharacterized protein LOC128203456 isoform X1 [Mya arenaria]|uniref:uncharacterized protein LOC128203456 isoform X1 n=1 Tax=Mya arenaria TaxID=6604 RepID=UPI0022DF55C4|nr:uncharacterized protein LOC128203456 isoform X1 [Mya arenaria]